MATTTELAFIPTQDLVEEIRRRFSASVVIGYRSEGNRDDYDDGLSRVCHWHDGPVVTCLGILEYARATLFREIAEAQDEDDA